MCRKRGREEGKKGGRKGGREGENHKESFHPEKLARETQEPAYL